MNNSLGINIGASAVKAVIVDENNRIVKRVVKNHESNTKDTLEKIIHLLDFEKIRNIAVTGRKINGLTNYQRVTEPEASEYALKYFNGRNGYDYNALVSLGSENFILYQLNKESNITGIKTGNKCASGTGEFFLQQIRRMQLSSSEAVDLANGSEPYFVSGRCSVFCKSDCTHALNKGVPIGRVSAGLGDMLSDKVMELLTSVNLENIIAVGGVTKNSYVVNKLSNSINNFTIPEEADVFEAFGAAVYARLNKTGLNGNHKRNGDIKSFVALPPLYDAKSLVDFKESQEGTIRKNGEYILGLDVGSTTTKAVLVDLLDNSIAASIYLRTNGNPVHASRNCYEEIERQVSDTPIKIIGLAVTGSGRQIAGLHALSDNIINEIIAHAAGAAFYDKDVDTIIEIGGQDAKYTYLINGVPCDYAMNEACSAGTGSFLEEAAKESLNINYLDIQDIALKAKHPPNFNDQCAAFISSDIKNASAENISKEDIIAGLVYSICMNYNNRVKGARKSGNKIFMQGGVCYNKAVPLAMAALMKKEIIVPPEPGLIGAFGAAIELKNRIESGLAEKIEFNLTELIHREVDYGKSFLCSGATENCDRGCTINLIKINGKNYPFGGICNKYYNTLHHLRIKPEPYDYVRKREKLVLERGEFAEGKSIGISRSFYTNMMFPLFKEFFTQLGLKIVLSDEIDPVGVKKTASSFCYPVEVAHGMFYNLIQKDTDYIFLPQIAELYVKGDPRKGKEHSCTCVLAQSEPYYLQSTFRNIKSKLIIPVLNFCDGWDTQLGEFVKIGKALRSNEIDSKKAYKSAVKIFENHLSDKKELGQQALEEIKKDKNQIGIILFGRSYNAFAEEINMGIPQKFSSRGIHIVPFDCLTYDDEPSVENMNWAVGTEMMKAAHFVKRHPQLFGVYITNFSCGPDSFLVGYFRDIMLTKPSLTLELDSHTADAGIDTRIEAFLDIIERYKKTGVKDKPVKPFLLARIKEEKGKLSFIDSEGKSFSVKNNKVKMIIPSMGRTSTELTEAAFKGLGFNAEAMPLLDFHTMMKGRENTSCKECLPLILTTASLLDYIEKNQNEGELICYFMPTATGNCRFSQYYVFLQNLIEKKQIKNVALLTLTNENSYAGFGMGAQLRILKALITADIFDDIKNTLLVLAEDKDAAFNVFEKEFKRIKNCLENNAVGFSKILNNVVKQLSKIKRRFDLDKTIKVQLAGEIYVRKDEFCSQKIITRLAERNIVVKRAPMLEWIYYVDYLVKEHLKPDMKFAEKIETPIRYYLQKRMEKKIKRIFTKSGLYEYDEINIKEIIKTGSNFIDPALTGESVVVTGGFFNEITKHIHGLISIGPFACMPSRITESILSNESNTVNNKRIESLKNADELKKFDTLPFLAIEDDGNPLPQIVEARVEAFALQTERLYQKLQNTK